MQTATYVALSRQTILGKVMDTLANNLANSSTSGFKMEKPLFEQYLASGPNGQKIAYVQNSGHRRDPKQGELATTSNPLDIAISGDGYFTVGTPNGTRYSRNGHLQLNAQSQLVTSSGAPVLDDSGQPITLPTGARPVIGQDGTVSVRGAAIAKLGLVSFADPQQLDSEGSGLYNTNAVPTPDTTSRVQQGMLEASNVQPVIEMTRLLDLQRTFSSQQQVLDDEDTRLKNAIDKLSKVS